MPESTSTEVRHPGDLDELLSLIQKVTVSIFGKSATTLDEVASESAELGALSLGCEDGEIRVSSAVAFHSELLGIRVALIQRSADAVLRSDVSVEYHWREALTADEALLRQLVLTDGIPRAVASAAAILADAAAGIGEKAALPILVIQDALLKQFRDRQIPIQITSES
ncbi:hypothetical protein [Rhodococcus sp. NPDC060084]|uniref:hypothetical protein n=1 Tax=Rhodococcus sp. NPDC060084 TaxID=3347053 RepID=UPI00366126F8